MSASHDGPASGAREKAAGRKRVGMGRKVAVIEDDASTAALLCTLLQLEGFVALSFDNTLDVWDQLREAGVDFLLCDDNMPGVRGQDVIAAIRERPGGARLPVVLMSGMYLDESEWRGARADGFLLKPFTRQDLLDALRSVERQPAEAE